MSPVFRAGLAALALLAAPGCQTFVGIEEAAAHLPRLDGSYLIAIDRVRVDGTTHDTIRMRGTAVLDVDTRSLELQVGILPATGSGGPLSETSISDIVFPDDSDETDLEINLSIPAMAIAATPAPDPADLSFRANVRFIAEADYAFCAKPATATPQPVVPTIGPLLVDDLTMLPPTADVTCDDAFRP